MTYLKKPVRQTEHIMRRVRTMVDLGLDKKAICDSMKNVPTELVFLAWCAAHVEVSPYEV